MIERLQLVDGTFELFRAHYSKRPDRPLKATHGVVDSLRALVREAGERVTTHQTSSSRRRSSTTTGSTNS